MTVFQGIHGLGEVKLKDGNTQNFIRKTQDDVYVANYRFAVVCVWVGVVGCEVVLPSKYLIGLRLYVFG